MARYYGTGPVDGYPGDEDQGQMGAWYVMSAMGLFEMDGGCAVEPTYEIGSPIFDRVVIHLDQRYYKGKTFVIEARNNSPQNIYIQSAILDGRPHRPRCRTTVNDEVILWTGPRGSPRPRVRAVFQSPRAPKARWTADSTDRGLAAR